MTVFYGPTIEVEHLNGLHDFLTARGWEPGEYVDCDDSGYPEDPEATWSYPDSFGGTVMHKVVEVTPYPLSCRFGFEDGLHIVISSGGNIQGCPEHVDTEHEFAVVDNQLDLERVVALLDDLEPHARELNPRDLIECRFFGPCGDLT